jgi:hypothetical protein
MPYFSASNLFKAQAIINDRFNSPELRQYPSPILDLGRRNTSILIPTHEQLRTREDRPIEAYIIKRNKRDTTGKIRTHDHTGAFGDTMPVDILFTSFVDTFKVSLKWLDNNMYDIADILANQFSQTFMNIREDIELFLGTTFLAEKTGVNKATHNGSWNSANQVFEISTSPDRGLFFEDAKSMMRQNGYNGTYDVIANPKLYRDFAFYANQGSGNATNLAFQFSGMNIMESTALVDSAYTNGVAIFLPSNSFGILDWIPRQNRQGWGDYNDYNGGKGVMTDPVSGLTFAVHGYAQRANTKATNGNEQDVAMEFEVSIDISPNFAPLSNQDETVVYEVAQVA